MEIVAADMDAINKENASASAAVAEVDNVEDNTGDKINCAKNRKFTFQVWNEFKVVTLKDK